MAVSITLNTRALASAPRSVATKCKDCGYGVMIDVQVKKKSGKRYRYLINNGWATERLCVKRSYQTVRIADVEEAVSLSVRQN